MLTQSMKTSVVGNKIGPAADPAGDHFCAITGHARLVATSFPTRKTKKFTVKTNLPSMYIRSFTTQFGITSCFPLVGAKLAHSIFPATCLA